MKTIKDLDINSKKVLIRVDFNVPIEDGKITDDSRIRGALKTIKYAIDKNAKVILFSHLGRVKEKSDLKKNDLSIVVPRLSELLNQKVLFSSNTRGEQLENIINNMKEKEVLLIQNTRYEDLDGKKESSNEEELGAYWASLGDVFINDAFGTIHRAHASNCGIAKHLPSAFGFLVENELSHLSELDNPERPYVVILGGAKVSDKIEVIENLVTKADKILIGGAMSFTFLSACGINVGKSLVDNENIEFCRRMLKDYNEKIVLPIDTNAAKSLEDENAIEMPVSNILPEYIGLDIGSKTIENYKEILKNSKTVVWNGPLGVYESNIYIRGTKEIMEYLVNNKIKTILGGGDIVAAASVLNLKDKVYHASTGGGATLEFLEGKELPGIISIEK